MILLHSASFLLCAILPTFTIWSRLGSVIRPRAGSEPEHEYDDEAMPLLHEACQIHAHWSSASNVDVACFDIFRILNSDQDSFVGNVDDFAGLLEPVIEDETRSQSEEVSTILRTWEYLSDEKKRAAYTAEFMPLIEGQRLASKVDCSKPQPRPPRKPRSGPMKQLCG
ncbi:hypothetical protein diail_7645, partial [Diaporthe ilicicola]